jgi:hypothetical protein
LRLNKEARSERDYNTSEPHLMAVATPRVRQK